ncbi:MAG: (d)CMP kinase [Proteobacteria bacterium]|nr:(d)CMP kinase [Pseudomonadota bacterium]MBI3498522.1 (d)CMP kinase [Pseudomonadota bacterium]
MIVAIDGPSASGKGTLARRIAKALGLPCLDTGLLYRATARRLIAAGIAAGDEAAALKAAEAVTAADLEAPGLRDEAVTRLASLVAAMPAVRRALFDFQRRFAGTPGGAVLDGRDIGTVVCPDADIKIYVDAAPEVRAERRVRELRERGLEAIPSAVLGDLLERDARDRGRRAAPLARAKDAFLLDTSQLDADQAYEAALSFIRSREPGRR